MDTLPTRKEILKGFGLVLFAVLVWSGWSVISRFGVKSNLTPYDITAIRFTTAGLILLPIALKKGFRIGEYGFRSALLMSVLMGACYTTIAIMGMQYAPVSHAGTTMNGSLVLVTTATGFFLLGEAFSLLQFSGVFITLAGIILMMTAKAVNSPDIHLGHALFLIAALMWGSYIYFVKKWKVDALHAASIVCVFSMCYYMPFYLLFANKSHINAGNWVAILSQAAYQGILTAIIAFICFNKGLAIIGAARAGAMIPLVPAIATLMAIPLLGEIPSSLEIIGVVTVSVGVLIASGIIKISSS